MRHSTYYVIRDLTRFLIQIGGSLINMIEEPFDIRLRNRP